MYESNWHNSYIIIFTNYIIGNEKIIDEIDVNQLNLISKVILVIYTYYKGYKIDFININIWYNFS